MAWVRGIRQCVNVLVANEPHERRGPMTMRQERVCVDLSAAAIEQTVGRRIHTLPDHRGAGPCGTLARTRSGRSYATWWSVKHLIAPLAAYYAAYVPPLRFGAKPGPRGRRAA